MGGAANSDRHGNAQEAEANRFARMSAPKARGAQLQLRRTIFKSPEGTRESHCFGHARSVILF
jgi:hypothetical protein